MLTHLLIPLQGMLNYANVLLDKDANEEVYQFWRKKVCERLTDPAKQQIMAPEKKPYFFGTKRQPLEHDYYDVGCAFPVETHVAAPAMLLLSCST